MRAGKSQSEMAHLLGLNAAWYADLEQRDDELASTLTLFQAAHLASLLGVELHVLFDDGVRPEECIPLPELPGRLEARAAQAGMSMAQLEDEVGWALREFIDSPVHVAAELPVAFFQAIAAALGVNWLSFVPREDLDGRS